MSVAVFLEHHEGQLQKGSLGVLAKAASLGEDLVGAVLGSGIKELAADAGRYGAAKVYIADAPELEAPLPQPRVDALAQLVADKKIDTVLFAASVLASDVAAGLSARLDAGLNWDLVDLAAQDGALVGKRPALSSEMTGRSDWAHHATALRCCTSSVNLGTISCRSPTTPRSQNSKIGAFGSLLIAITVPEPCMPTLCWIAPEMPQAM